MTRPFSTGRAPPLKPVPEPRAHGAGRQTSEKGAENAVAGCTRDHIVERRVGLQEIVYPVAGLDPAEVRGRAPRERQRGQRQAAFAAEPADTRTQRAGIVHVRWRRAAYEGVRPADSAVTALSRSSSASGYISEALPLSAIGLRLAAMTLQPKLTARLATSRPILP